MASSATEPEPVRPAEPERLPARSRWPARAGGAAALALPVGLTVWLAFSRGGFFVGETSIAAAIACLALLLWTMLADDPTAGLGRAGALAVGAFVLLTAWTLASTEWADSAARPVYEFNRALLYLAVFALVATRPRGSLSARWLVRGVAAAMVAVAVAGLGPHLLPETFAPPAGDPATDRLTWPLGYWNSMGLATALGLVLCVHLASDLREHAAVRVVAAALSPLPAAALYLTLSRGSVLAAVVGLALLVGLGRSRGLTGGLAATLPAVALAVVAAAGAGALTDGYKPDATATIDAGRELAGQLGLLCGLAAIVRLAALPLDRRIARLRIAPWSWRRWAVAVAAALVAVAAVAVVVDAPDRLSDQWREFRSTKSVAVQGDERFLEASPNGRIQSWEVALDTWRSAPAAGVGAGTFAYEWAQRRTLGFAEQDAHSLYLEFMAELGIVGLALLLAVLLIPLAAALRRRHRRRDERPLWSAVVAVGVLWMLHAGVDWDWEMPSVTLPVLALLASACAREAPRTAGRLAAIRLPRLIGGLAILLIAVTPVRVALSQQSVDEALDAFRARDCPTAIDRALDAQSVFGSRPDSYELIGYCDSRLGRPDLGVRMLRAALDREPRSWELLYGLALVQATAGEDPRPTLREASALNPRERLIGDALERMRSDKPKVWRREAVASRLIVPEEPERATLVEDPDEPAG